MTIRFSIDQKIFNASPEILSADEFTVDSVPRPYQVKFDVTHKPLEPVNALLQKNPKNLLLIDRKVLALYREQITIAEDRIFAAEASEAFKTLDGVTQVLDFLQTHDFTKGELLIVVGGGIIQDIGAFVGAVYKRGIAWMHFPTTLLAMCDSCIGGKAGVNYNQVKNQLALFSAPRAIIINPVFLESLDQDAINSGLGEILKLCIIGGKPFLDLYKQYVQGGQVKKLADFRALILAALAVKKAIVEKDEFELHHRKSLNYGHTLGHAVESLSHYAIPHGQAVVVGMVLVNYLSHAQGLLSKNDLDELNVLCFDLLGERILNILKTLSLDSMISLLKKDKKTEGQVTNFIFMKNIGDTHFVKLVLDEKLAGQIQQAFSKIISS